MVAFFFCVCRKLHHVWKVPFQALQRVSNGDYHIDSLSEKKQVHIVHFDHFKLCTPGTQFMDDTLSDKAKTDKHELDTSPFGSN